MARHRHWSPAEEKKLAKLYRTMPAAEVASILGVTIQQVYCKAKLMGITRKLLNAPKHFTRAEIKKLKKVYPDMLAKDVAAMFDCTVSAVYKKAMDLGLQKSERFKATQRELMSERGKTDPRFIAGRFQKGLIPFNKGMRRPGWFVGRMRETQFKKGRLPHTTHPDFYVLGALRINADGYIDIRTSFERGSKGWTGLHRYIWIAEHGPVPAGHMITFKDGDRMNVVLENLQLISMADNARRNYIDRYPKEVRRLVTLKAVITRHVRRIEREAQHVN